MFKKAILLSLFGLVTVLSVSQSVFAMRQPGMENSLQALENAERILKKARPNKGGHRAKALIHIRKAKQEIVKGISFANRRADEARLKLKREADARNARSKELRERNLRHKEEGSRKSRDLREKKRVVKPRSKEYRVCVKNARGNERRIRTCEREFGGKSSRRDERREVIREERRERR